MDWAPSELLRLLPVAPAALLAMQDQDSGALQPPIRAELFGPQRFAQHGRSLGDTHQATRGGAGAASFFPRLRSNISVLRQARHYIGAQAASGYDISPAAEWLLDNFHLIEAQIKEIHEGLPSRYFRALPLLIAEPLAGLPRIYGVAWAFVAHTDSAFDAELLQAFLNAYQETRELTLGETWALPTTLRVVLIENLRRLAERVATQKAARELANLFCDRLDGCSLHGLDQLHRSMQRRGVGPVFLAQLALRLQDRSTVDQGHVQGWLLDWLHRALPDPAALQAQLSADQTADNLSVSNAVNSLRAIAAADWPELIAHTSSLMRLMLGAPVFAAEHSQTRDQSLHRIERLAKRSGRSELSVAKTLLDLMQLAPDGSTSAPAAAGYWLQGAGRPTLLRALGLREPGLLAWRTGVRRLRLPLYLGTLALGTAALVGALLPRSVAEPGWLLWLGLVLMLIPASEAVVALLNRMVSESLRPQHLPRLALTEGIPAEHRVMVVIPALLGDLGSIRALAQRLQLHHLANPEAHTQFALLSDWADAEQQQLDGDDDLLTEAAQQLRALNLRHPGAPGAPPRFLLLHRQRRFSASEQRWIGWERKRGKLEQLVEALATGDAAAFMPLGELTQIAADTRYIITLDTDTGMPPGRLRELVGVAAHPHNQPRLDANGQRLLGGYGILQPRVVTPLPAERDMTPYHWLFAGRSGIDPYSAASSEVYQDLFHEGTFTGKGLLHVRAVHALLAGRLPEGQVLSHDLLEGSLARCAAVSDITLIEEAPFHADVAASRVHRWTRGDWQLLPLLLKPGRYRLRAINRWKMFDNLRRSLVAPAALALLLLSLAGLVLSPAAALTLVLAAFTAGPLLGALAGLAPSRDDLALGHFYRQAMLELVRALAGGLWHLSQLAQQALLALDAITRSLYRTLISRRKLLQWTTAAAAQAAAKTGLLESLRQHWRAPLLSLLLLGVLLASGRTPYPALTLALALLWLSAPLLSWWVSRPRRRAATRPAAEQAYLGGVARDTWRFFERCVSPEDLHLPPDNLQTLPHEMLAHRSSPTNFGLYLLSVVCARQFGWIGTEELLKRLEATLASMAGLQRYRGHFLNWYDTQTRAPLLPMYVSSVDSGNLCGHLLAVAQACLELAQTPYDEGPARRALAASRQRLRAMLPADSALLAETCKADSFAQLIQAENAAEPLAWLLADHLATLRSMELDRQAMLLCGEDSGHSARLRLRALARDCEVLAWAADFKFLYSDKRQLFHIGFRVAEQQLDEGFFDLLASESRLTSLLAIAKGDVPVRHWSALGRPFYAQGTAAGLRSWSGSMFEYLMPGLVLDEPQGSALREACEAAVREQIDFGEQHGTPWGVSESAYAGSDHTLAYQYAPQGVPRLALRRTPPDELVIAPYATAMAAPLAPQRALQNLQRLESLGARGRYGFIEALDFTPSRRTGAAAFMPVSTFMSHHQGMSIVALANLLLGGVAQRWGMADAHLQAVASLLHESAPREVSRLAAPEPGPPPQAATERSAGLLREVVPGMAAIAPTHLLSNGRYSVSLRANGAGSSHWGRQGISRWRDDALRDAYGSFFYVRRRPGAAPVSLSQHPAPDPAAQYQALFHADRVSLLADWPDLQSQITAWVSPEDDIEFRQVELRNTGDKVLEIELISGFEPSLAEARADEAHPAFGNLFVRAEWRPAQQALCFERKPRLATERGLHAAHFLTHTEHALLGISGQTDRALWLGRNRAVNRPLAQLRPLPASGDTLALETGLDPVCVLGVSLRIAPHAKAVLTFATAASDDAGVLHAVIDKYHQQSHVQRASLMSATLAGIRLRALRISPEHFAAVQSLSTALLLSLTRPLALPGVCDRRLLWRFGISGDRPLILVTAGVMAGVGLLRTLAQALRLWAWGGLACDLVVVNAEPVSYQMALQREIAALRERHGSEGSHAHVSTSASTGFHQLRAEELSADELSTLQQLARVRLHADGRPLLHHLQAWSAQHEQALAARQETSGSALEVASGGPAQPARGSFANGGEEFRFEVDAAVRAPRPWINVLANPEFGYQLSEGGGGHSWARNSRMNQLTAWSNDPLADPPSEWFLLQDLRSLEVWSTAPGAWGDQGVAYRVAHGQGYTRISHRRGDLEVRAVWCVDPKLAVKQLHLSITNRGAQRQQLRLIGIAEWMMGAQRSDRGTVHTALHSQRLPDGPDGACKLSALLATQPERSGGLGEGTAFLAIAGPADTRLDWSCDRRECFDARGRLVLPDHFGQRSGAGLDPCAALAVTLNLPAGQTEERTWLLGWAENPDAARQLAAVAAAVPPQQRLDTQRRDWDALLSASSVKTPDPLFDALVNRWLLYQAVSCRLWAKAGFYQAGGATGFRDQLQDSMALAWAAPHLLREQILACAARQYPEGDVQHWWHAPGGAGVRTHFSDDLLWLPHACVHYLRTSGDAALLEQRLPFLEGAAIPEGAEDAYYTPTISSHKSSVYEHAALTLDRSLRVGVHGLPLMGTGDWNDGMNRVGHQGRGESVWLAWFACRIVSDFAPLARERGDNERAERWERAAAGWRAALAGPAWDGQWYKRAFFDDGQPLGSAANSEARIDLIAQAWAVLSGVEGGPGRAQQAMASAHSLLVDAQAGLIRLLDPPLIHAEPSAGYIQAYPPGVRENGGQYSHAGIWALMAQARLNRPSDLPYQYFCHLSPAHRAAHPLQGPVYGLEPYVMAGDIYTQPPYIGRGGWSWYTGAAAWLHRAALEAIFGLKQEAESLSFAPCLPAHWPEAELTLRRNGQQMRFILMRATPQQARAAAASAGATLIEEGQVLRWQDLALETCFVLPLTTTEA
ncbi:carbohydrate-binding protein [Paucibacter sp. PLA-PC-4]|uniref:GH36-type glycosyl hydrolase domain-containing protein n=1 Tax=Paucibacter sp. PLA-PC-4 TaxID=2993655 RepID=UPI00224974A8|nr:glucoamylase family protein [Paucibacter sp. PLA-PC-4]MCX2863272.1 carbohydrate-binding protein [Paucibacter sp. PLA-PC-4]